MSVRRRGAGDGYRYLLGAGVAVDRDRSLSTPLTRYYAEAGRPPGFWMGSAVPDVGGVALQPGITVSEQQLQYLLGAGADLVDGAPLGRAYPVYASTADRVARRTAELGSRLGRLSVLPRWW